MTPQDHKDQGGGLENLTMKPCVVCGETVWWDDQPEPHHFGSCSQPSRLASPAPVETSPNPLLEAAVFLIKVVERAQGIIEHFRGNQIAMTEHEEEIYTLVNDPAIEEAIESIRALSLHTKGGAR